MLRCSIVVLVALLAAGCTFNWGDGAGISDVKVAGRDAGTLGPQPPPPDETVATKDDDDDDESSQLRLVAILPVAWSDGQGGGQPCDLCPESVQMKATGALPSRLATGFLYEAVARHPRLLFPTPEVVDRAVQASPGRSLKGAAASLAAEGHADLAIALALIELRPRIGDDDSPEKPAGVALFATLVDARTGEVLWSETFDGDESSRGVVLGTYDKVMNDRPVRWRTAEEFSEYAVDELAEEIIDEID